MSKRLTYMAECCKYLSRGWKSLHHEVIWAEPSTLKDKCQRQRTITTWSWAERTERQEKVGRHGGDGVRLAFLEASSRRYEQKDMIRPFDWLSELALTGVWLFLVVVGAWGFRSHKFFRKRWSSRLCLWETVLKPEVGTAWRSRRFQTPRVGVRTEDAFSGGWTNRKAGTQTRGIAE